MRLVAIFHWREFLSQQVAISGRKKTCCRFTEGFFFGFWIMYGQISFSIKLIKYKTFILEKILTQYVTKKSIKIRLNEPRRIVCITRQLYINRDINY